MCDNNGCSRGAYYPSPPVILPMPGCPVPPIFPDEPNLPTKPIPDSPPDWYDSSTSSGPILIDTSTMVYPPDGYDSSTSSGPILIDTSTMVDPNAVVMAGAYGRQYMTRSMTNQAISRDLWMQGFRPM